jgi:DNA-binding transcriptional LysR family regulator
VSHALGRLRDLFDDELFTRRPRGLVPTARAIELAEPVEAMLALAAESLATSSAFDPAQTDRAFTLSAPEFVTALVGSGLLRDLSRRAPNASLVFSYLGPEAARKAVREGALDLAIGRFSGDAPTGMRVEPLLEDHYCVVARRDHPELRGRVTLRQFQRTGHVFASSESEVMIEERSFYRQIRSVAVVPYWLTALHLVATSDAIVTCPRSLAERHAGRLRLQILNAPFVEDSITVSALTREHRHDAATSWLLERVRAAIGGE